MLFILQKGMQKFRERMCMRQMERKKEEGEEEEEEERKQDGGWHEWVSTYYDYRRFLLDSFLGLFQ